MKKIIYILTILFTPFLLQGQSDNPFCPGNTDTTNPDIVNSDNNEDNDVFDWRVKYDDNGVAGHYHIK